ncbi:uncharacterized protein LOC141652146 [Silene latifolia]|uniref:uncharacterized protein LOC141652146 n=1 Tax=Silene latifolia TaxID=37657 RepID=UPI003D76E954
MTMTIVPTIDKPSYRVVELRKVQSTMRLLYLLRTNDGDQLPEPSLSLTAIDLPFGSTSTTYTLVGSASGVLCFYFKDRNLFILWNPSSGLLCSIACPDNSCPAYAFFRSLTSDNELIILALTKSVTNSSTCTFRRYSTETSRWDDVKVVTNYSREGSMTGPGFVAGQNIYWAGYRENSKLDSVVMYDITLGIVSVIPTNAPFTNPYDFFCLLTHVTLVGSETYFVLQRRTTHSSELLRLQGDIWVFICETNPASCIIDVVAKNRLLVLTGDILEMRDGDMKLLSRCPFAETYICPFVVLHSPNDEDVPSLKVYAEKNQKRSFMSMLKSAFGIRSSQSSPRLEKKSNGSSSRPLRRDPMGSSSMRI